MKNIKFITLFLTAFLLLNGCSKDESNTQTSQSEQYKIADEIELTSIIGTKATLIRTENGFKLKDSDKILMLDIFGTYCAPCQKEAPHLMDFQLKNADKFMLIGLIHFEDVSDEYVLENFSKKYNAYYFIANSKENSKIVDQILNDINYNRALSIPFKVVLKDGIYQSLSDNIDGTVVGNKFYLGEVSTNTISQDIDKILNAN
ncbi:TlpA family protein disulfide reductase [Campylobacter sp. CX2-8023-23]|uniref:TlpA family protein disulfide reductase n=1 Tax=Campylobacter porcelli TaxID=1660073 RepID=A0ABU7M214_9BACT|nr:TlpA family protein disulfide reductase [Campylobacter sp. CX2-8023-23]MEE3743739.1 TlpA family protein disulfide reductase [Campylobacter sp. CX2-4855-23]MEE3775998.1 TlpA family protein disulfide reductase [Campylobacter sp. CX2-4080-23]